MATIIKPATTARRIPQPVAAEVTMAQEKRCTAVTETVEESVQALGITRNASRESRATTICCYCCTRKTPRATVYRLDRTVVVCRFTIFRFFKDKVRYLYTKKQLFFVQITLRKRILLTAVATVGSIRSPATIARLSSTNVFKNCMYLKFFIFFFMAIK